MTITKTGGVSQNAVLADIGYGPGSMRVRPLYNRLSRTGGDLRLDDFRGNACATQNNITGPDNATGPNLYIDRGYHGFYPKRDRYPYVVNGNTLYCELNARGYRYTIGDGNIYYEPGGDATSQASFHFRLKHSGTYRITGRLYTSSYTGTYNRGLAQWQVAVTSGSVGYLDTRGSFNLDFNYLTSNNGSYGGSNSQNFNQTVNLTTARPYASMHLYGISKSGGEQANTMTNFYFENFKMVKV